MDIKNLAEGIVKYCGGKENIGTATNCMTRVRIIVWDDKKVQEDELRHVQGVMAVLHDNENYFEVVVGPGVCKQVTDYIKEHDMLCDDTTGKDGKIEKTTKDSDLTAGDWKENKKKIKGEQKSNPVKNFLKIVGEIFVPLIPGIMTSGIAAALAILLTQLCPDYEDIPVMYFIYGILTLVKASFMTYITAWAGYRTAERFGGTPILGGMIGMITNLNAVNDIAAVVGMDANGIFGQILSVGRGGVIAAVIGAWAVSKVEQWVRKRVHPNVDIIVTPIVSVFIVVIPYVLLIMPLAGLLSTGIGWVVQVTTASENIFVRIISGYVTAALFLPLVALGMHHSLIAIYTVQLESIGYITLYPSLCMAGFGQIGAAIAIYQIAKKVGNDRLRQVIFGALPAGILGVGEPLIYGVTLPLGRPFFTAGLGAGFGGALLMALQVGSTTWGPSGVLGVFAVTAGPLGAVANIGIYLLGGAISVIAAYLISRVGLIEKDIKEF